jgi:integrase
MAMKKHLTRKSIYTVAPKTGRLDIWDTAPGFGLRITANGTRTYTVMGRLNGLLVRRTLGSPPAPDTPADTPDDELPVDVLWPERARSMAADWRHKMSSGTDPKPPMVKAPAKLPEPANDTTADVEAPPRPGSFADHAARCLADTGKGLGRLKTANEIARKVKVDLAAWRNRPTESITTEEIEDLVEDKHDESPGGVANQLLSAIRGIFKYAKRKRWIARNPAADVEPPSTVKSRDRVLSLSELKRIWDAAKEMSYPFGRVIQLLILTAQRRSEVNGLEWYEIEGDAWMLPNDRAKRGLGHLIHLTPLALTILGGLPKYGNGGGLVFTTNLKSPVSGWSKAKIKLDRIIAEQAAKAADEPLDLQRHSLRPWRIHDIRRSVSTALRDAQIMGAGRVERLVVSKILNHSEGGTTQIYDRYSADPEQMAALIAWGDVVKRGFTRLETVKAA